MILLHTTFVGRETDKKMLLKVHHCVVILFYSCLLSKQEPFWPYAYKVPILDLCLNANETKKAFCLIELWVAFLFSSAFRTVWPIF